MLHKVNFKIKVTIYLHEYLRKVRINRKIDQENIQKSEQTITTSKKQNKGDVLPSQLFPNDFSEVAYMFLS